MTKRAKLTLAEKISRLKEFLKALRLLQKTVDRKKYFSEDMVRRTVERYLQLALEAAFDIADQIINEEKLRKPQEYRDTMLILGEHKILPKEFAFRFAGAAGFRNVLVHDYVKLDDQKVFEHFKKDAGEIEKFVQYAVKYLA